jgi:putative glycosyltransferase (TIGR04372 family)
MKMFIEKQIYQIKQGGITVLVRKIKLLFRKTFNLLLCILAIPVVLIMRLIRPWLLVRLGSLISSRIGHFGPNTEMYLCERDAGINVPNQRYVDVFYMAFKPICNKQLAIMWHRVLHIWPAWILSPIKMVNQLIPGGKVHEVGNNTQSDRDVHNLLDQIPRHLQFTSEEEMRGEAGLRLMGIPMEMPFVCLIVRDSAYLAEHLCGGNLDTASYHNYRDSDIQEYRLAAETLADRGFFVIRMGVNVNTDIKSTHPKVIDYATNGMRSDFMDIYLGAKCAFCISTGTGFDGVPMVFRRPIAYVNMAPAGYFPSFSSKQLGIFKHYLDANTNCHLTLLEIFSSNTGFSCHGSDLEIHGVNLIDNTPEEIRDVAVEMVERLNNTWQEHPEDKALQQHFLELFTTGAFSESRYGNPLHGKIRARFGAAFLRNNREWLQ